MKRITVKELLCTTPSHQIHTMQTLAELMHDGLGDHYAVSFWGKPGGVSSGSNAHRYRRALEHEGCAIVREVATRYRSPRYGTPLNFIIFRDKTMDKIPARARIKNFINRAVNRVLKAETERDELQAVVLELTYKLAQAQYTPTGPCGLLACPFCGGFPEPEPYEGGSLLEIHCPCGMAGTSVSIADFLTSDETKTFAGDGSLFGPEYVGRALKYLKTSWNTRPKFGDGA